MITNTDPIGNPADRPLAGVDIQGAGDAVTLRSAPDLALPKESESAAPVGFDQPRTDALSRIRRNPAGAIAAAGVAGMLAGIAFKKSLPARRKR